MPSGRTGRIPGISEDCSFSLVSKYFRHPACRAAPAALGTLIAVFRRERNGAVRSDRCSPAAQCCGCKPPDGPFNGFCRHFEVGSGKRNRAAEGDSGTSCAHRRNPEEIGVAGAVLLRSRQSATCGLEMKQPVVRRAVLRRRGRASGAGAAGCGSRTS